MMVEVFARRAARRHFAKASTPTGRPFTTSFESYSTFSARARRGKLVDRHPRSRMESATHCDATADPATTTEHAVTDCGASAAETSSLRT
jgi:hypothetical protein